MITENDLAHTWTAFYTGGSIFMIKGKTFQEAIRQLPQLETPYISFFVEGDARKWFRWIETLGGHWWTDRMANCHYVTENVGPLEFLVYYYEEESKRSDVMNNKKIWNVLFDSIRIYRHPYVITEPEKTEETKDQQDTLMLSYLDSNGKTISVHVSYDTKDERLSLTDIYNEMVRMIVFIKKE